MKTTRITAAVVATLAFFAADHAWAQEIPAGNAGDTIVLNTYSKVWVLGDNLGPQKVGKLTGAGTMDPSFNWDDVAYKADPSKVRLLTNMTRSDDQPNGNNSYLQGLVAVAELTAQGVKPTGELKLPKLNGDRPWLRPIIAPLTGNRALACAASEDHGGARGGGNNGNPMPVCYLINTAGEPALIPITNKLRNNPQKPENIIAHAIKGGIKVNNENDQRGPHTITCPVPDTCVVGMQYDNQAQEAFSVSVTPDNALKVNWLQRYSENAVHNRPSVAIEPGATTGYLTSVECNAQPANIGISLVEFDVATGKSLQRKLVAKADPKNNKYVSESTVSIMNDSTLVVTHGLSSKVRDRNGNNGHTGGKSIQAAVLVKKTDFTALAPPEIGVGPYGRHSNSYVTSYGPNGEPALATIGGSSTGTGASFIQIFPLKTDGLLGVKDAMKTYQVGSSRVDLQACKLEYSIVSPK